MRKPLPPAGTRAARRMAGSLCWLLFVAVSSSWASAPQMEFHTPSSMGDATVSATMRDLAARLVPVYQDADPDRYLATLSALQMVAGNYAAAYVSRQSLLDRRRPSETAGRGP